MNDSQLPLFDWQTMVMGEGYRRLVDFKFEEAEQHFLDVLHAKQGDEEEIERALHTCQYWRPLVERNIEASGAYSPEDLYKEFRRYDFENEPGLQQFKHALLECIADRLIAADRFYVSKNDYENETVSDLLLELRHHKKAERMVLLRMEKQPDDAQLLSCANPVAKPTKRRGQKELCAGSPARSLPAAF